LPDSDPLKESAWDRAKADAEGVYRTPWFGLAVAIVELLAIPTAVLFTAGGDTSTATQIAVPILSGAVALVIVFLSVLVIQLAVAPVRQRNELRREWPSPLRRTPLSAEIALRNLVRTGDDMADSMSQGMGYTTDDEEAAQNWTNEVVQALSEGEAEAAARDFIAASEGVPGAPRKLRARVKKLREIAEGMANDP